MKKLDLTYKHVILYVLTFLIIVLGDQITKVIVDHTLQFGGAYTIIEDFFYFIYYQNQGTAWSISEGKIGVFLIVVVVAIIGIFCYFKQSHAYQKLTRFGFVLVLSGAIGNLIDRIVFGYVCDFIGFNIFGYSFPIFSVVDMAIIIGIGLIVLEVVVEEYKARKILKSELQKNERVKGLIRYWQKNWLTFHVHKCNH